MAWFVGRGNRASDSSISHDPFEEKLGPGMTTKFSGPIRQWLGARSTEEIAAAKRPVNDNRNAAFLRKRQKAFFGFAFHERIVDLYKIELFASYDFLHVSECACFVVRNPQVTDAPLRLPFTQCRQLRLNVDEIVDLHQIDSFRTQERHRTFQRFNSVLLAARPNFRGKKSLVLDAQRSRQLANHIFGMTIHRRRIDYASAKLYKKRKNVPELSSGVRCKVDIECLPGSQANHRQS